MISFLVGCVVLAVVPPLPANVVAAVSIGSFPQTSFLQSTYHEQGGRLVERDTGRERIWHGLNVVYKAWPWIPEFTEEHMELMQQLGLNAIRLGVMWPGVEPEPGVYNYTYLDATNSIIDAAAKHGIWSLIDCHQDLFSERFCGAGIPMWASQPDTKYQGFPYPLQAPCAYDNNTGYPVASCCGKYEWGTYYFAEQVASSFQTLYSATSVREHFVKFWTELARQFKNKTSIIGYELLNEPWCGDNYLYPELMVPGVADNLMLQPFYDAVNGGIRSADPDNHVVFFESVTWDDFGNGFAKVPGGSAYVNTSALAYHLYFPPQLDLNETIWARMNDLKRLQIPGMLTEFDIYDDNVALMEATLAISDVNFQSWLAWEYSSVMNVTGGNAPTYHKRNAKALSRTYAQAIGGHGLSMLFDPVSSAFQLVYSTQDVSSVADPILARTTEISVCQLHHYPNGYTVHITSEPANSTAAITYNATQTFLYVTAHPQQVPAQTIITVNIKAM